jgi:hypothetical protein
MHPIIQQIAQEYKKALQDIYGNDLAELVLFGSYARGDQHSGSDVDFAILFQDNHITSLDDNLKISKFDSRFSLKYGLMFSSLTTNLNKKKTSMQGVYQEIRKEGISI